MNRTTNLAIVGTGAWGLNHVRTFAGIDACRVHSVVDANPDNLARARALTPDAKALSDFRPLLDDRELDAAIIATPGETHYEITRQLLMAGKHVLVEKPLAETVAQAQELCLLARERDVRLMVGHILLFHPSLQALREHVEFGAFGRIQRIEAERGNPDSPNRTEDAIRSFALHDIYSMMYLLDEIPTAASAHSVNGNGFRDNVSFSLSFGSGVTGTGRASWQEPHKTRLLRIVGELGTAAFDDTAAPSEIPCSSSTDYTDSTDCHPTRKSVTPLEAECLHFLECVRNGRKPLSDGEDGLATIRVISALQQSLNNSGRPIQLDESV